MSIQDHEFGRHCLFHDRRGQEDPEPPLPKSFIEYSLHPLSKKMN